MRNSSRTGEGKGREILVLGETTFRADYKRFGLLPPDRLRHLWVLGKTGSGKSSLLASLVAQDLARGNGLALLDPHGDLVETALLHTPERRVQDIVLFAPEDKAYPVSFNVFRQGRRLHEDPALLASNLISVFRKQWPEFWGPRLEHVLRNAILAVATDPRASLLFLYRFLLDDGLRTKVATRLKNPVVRQFWTKEFPGYTESLQSEAFSPVLNKLGAFVAHPIVRNIVGQVRSRLDIRDLMNRRGVLLAKLSTGRIGEDASHLLGGLLLTSIQLAAMERTRAIPPFIVYADEFQYFVTESIATMLSESRKFGLGLVLAHQYLAQLPAAVRDAVLGNVGSTMLFRLGGTDAAFLSQDFSPEFDQDALSHLPRYHVAAKLLAHGRALRPFSARTLAPRVAPPDGIHVAERVRAESRLRYARPRELVDAAIARSLSESLQV